MKAGVLFRLGSLWIGAHWSARNGRLCVNLVPCVTIWIVFRGGVVPVCAACGAYGDTVYGEDLCEDCWLRSK